MPKVVINACYGGFGLSHAAVMAYADRTGMTLYPSVDELSVKHFGEPDDLNTYRGIVHYYKVPPDQYAALKDEIEAAGEDYKRLNAMDWYFSYRDIERNDPDLLAVVETLGEAASGRHAKLIVVDVPDGVEWDIEEYDGLEHVAEKHRVWS